MDESSKEGFNQVLQEWVQENQEINLGYTKTLFWVEGTHISPISRFKVGLYPLEDLKILEGPIESFFA